MRDTEIQQKALELATWAKWSGDLLIKVFLEALTEANWHTERIVIEKALESVNEKESKK